MLHLIHNPVAGRGRGRDAARRASALLNDAGVDHRIWTTEQPGHGTEIASALPEDATVVALGGDGTVHELLPACVGTNRTLGIVPLGSGDDFAHALGLPRTRIEPAIAALVTGRTRVVDAGRCNDELFLNAVGTGFDAEVGARVTDAPRPLSGMGAYLWSVFVTLREFSLARLRVEVDRQVVFHDRSLLVSVQNGPRTGGSFHFAPAAKVDDGIFEVIIAGDLTRAGTMGLLPRVMVGRHLGHPKVTWVRGSSIRLTWDRARVWHAEGEIHAPAGELRVECLPRSLRVIAP